MTKRVARIILPRRRNEGQSLSHVHSWLKNTLCTTYGGCTMVHAYGVWRAPSGTVIEEPVCVYDVAMEPTSGNSYALRQIAVRLAEDAKQEEVYIVYPEGDVGFVPAKNLITSDEEFDCSGNKHNSAGCEASPALKKRERRWMLNVGIGLVVLFLGLWLLGSHRMPQ